MNGTDSVTEYSADFPLPSTPHGLASLLQRALQNNECTSILVTDTVVRVSAYATSPSSIDVTEHPVDLRQLLAEVDMTELTGYTTGAESLLAAMKYASKVGMYVIGILAMSERTMKPLFNTDWEVSLPPLGTSGLCEFIGMQVGFVPDVLDEYTLLFACGKARWSGMGEALLCIKVVL